AERLQSVLELEVENIERLREGGRNAALGPVVVSLERQIAPDRQAARPAARQVCSRYRDVAERETRARRDGPGRRLSLSAPVSIAQPRDLVACPLPIGRESRLSFVPRV